MEYEGTRYDGWQRQGNTDRTIQGKLETVLGRLFDTRIEVQGSGRTDAGVHAAGQVAHFHVPADAVLGSKERCLQNGGGKEICCQELESCLNSYLPEDIGVFGMERTGERFHSRYQAVGKTYCYRIWTGERKLVFARRFVWQLPGRLDAEAMRRAAALVIGTKDFASFCGNTRMRKSTVRTVDRLEITEADGLMTIRIHGDGFLQNMVRILTGTLVEIGQGKRPWNEMGQIMEARGRAAAGVTAPPQGLCLESVEYDPPFLPPDTGRRNIW